MRGEEEKDDETGFPHPFDLTEEQHLWIAAVQLRICDYNGDTKASQEDCLICHEELHADKDCVKTKGPRGVQCTFLHSHQKCAENWFEYEFEGICELLGLNYEWARKELGWTNERGWPQKLNNNIFGEGKGRKRGRSKASRDTGLSGEAWGAD